MTLMEQLEALKDDVTANPEAHVSGKALTEMLRTTPEDIIEFQEETKFATAAMKMITGSTDVALDGMIQTVLTIGYQLCLTHQAEDAEPVPSEEESTHETRV